MTYWEALERLRQEECERVRQGAAPLWDYYRIHCDREVPSYFADPRCFLQRTFEYAYKEILLDATPYGERGISQARAAHSISALLFGAMLAEHWCGGRYLTFWTETETREKVQFEFSYLWTLTALVHDMGYRFEQNERLGKDARAEGLRSIGPGKLDGAVKQFWCRMLRRLKITRTPWGSLTTRWNLRKNEDAEEWLPEEERLRRELYRQYQARPTCVYAGDQVQPLAFPTRTELEIARYAAFRMQKAGGKEGCADHGIFGGLHFFDEMIQNYVKAYRDHSTEQFENFHYLGKQFCTEQITMFAYLADCVVNHNIWRQEPQSERGELCKALGLYSVIGTNYEKLRLERNPLLFLLAFADSLEPYKLFCKGGIDGHPYNPAEVRQGAACVEMDFRENTLILTVPEEQKKHLKDALKGMEQWLAIRSTWRKESVHITPCLDN